MPARIAGTLKSFDDRFHDASSFFATNNSYGRAGSASADRSTTNTGLLRLGFCVLPERSSPDVSSLDFAAEAMYFLRMLAVLSAHDKEQERAELKRPLPFG
jgi:hypothetical protein